MKINIEQLSLESGVQIKGVATQGDNITFEGLTPEEELKVREALKTYVYQEPIKTLTTAEDKLKQILEIINK